MAVQTSYPGVYIEEFAPGAPIQGVQTNIAAFIGLASSGELDEPTKITSWDQFLATFGTQPLPGRYLWYAVRGFFENNGTVCYVVRASNGAYAELTLPNRLGDDLFTVRARQPGDPATPIKVEIDTTGTALIGAGVLRVYQPVGTVAADPGTNEITLGSGEGARFRPGDTVVVGASMYRAAVLRVAGETLRLDTNLAGLAAMGEEVRLADAVAGTRTIRLEPLSTLPANSLVPGTVLTIDQGTDSDTQVVDSVQTEYLGSAGITYRVTFRNGLDFSVSMDPTTAATVESEEFDITVSQGTAMTAYTALSADSAHPRYYIDVINDDNNGLVTAVLIEPPPPVSPPDSLPDATGAAMELADGDDENLSTIDDTNYIEALETLEQVDEVSLIAIPDAITLDDADVTSVQQALITHCEQLGDRFAVIDARPGLDIFGTSDSIEAQRAELTSTRGYAALYYPWLRVQPAGSGDPILVPPSGHVCGIIARSDASRGVHKAPANEIVAGAIGVERTMSDIDHGQLNLQGINVIRVFRGSARPELWGARTTASDLNWQYVNIRRLFLFLEESIQEGIRWAVFEPNNHQLWQKLKRTITAFLMRVWRDGALFGETPEDAFYVRIDEALNPFSEQALGRLYIEIGVRPAYPAEFIIVRIGIWPGGSEVTES